MSPSKQVFFRRWRWPWLGFITGCFVAGTTLAQQRETSGPRNETVSTNLQSLTSRQFKADPLKPTLQEELLQFNLSRERPGGLSAPVPTRARSPAEIKRAKERELRRDLILMNLEDSGTDPVMDELLKSPEYDLESQELRRMTRWERLSFKALERDQAAANTNRASNPPDFGRSNSDFARERPLAVDAATGGDSKSSPAALNNSAIKDRFESESSAAPVALKPIFSDIFSPSPSRSSSFGFQTEPTAQLKPSLDRSPPARVGGELNSVGAIGSPGGITRPTSSFSGLFAAPAAATAPATQPSFGDTSADFRGAFPQSTPAPSSLAPVYQPPSPPNLPGITPSLPRRKF